MEKIDKELFEEFITTSVKIKKVLNDNFMKPPIEFSKTKSTILQHQVLMFLTENPGISVKNLAGTFLMSSASIAQLLARLEVKDYIKKEQDQNDKRVFHIFLTKNGYSEIKRLKSFFFEKVSRVLKHIPHDDLRNMIRIQKNLLHELEKEYKYV